MLSANKLLHETTETLQVPSAQLFAAGLLPPTGEDLWHDTIQWQPIPVYLKGPYLLVSNPSQHRQRVYRKKFRGALKEYFKNNVKEDVRAFISKNVGVDITTLDYMTGIYDSYQVGKDLGVALPEWLSKVYIDHLWECNYAYLKCFIHTDKMKKMFVGRLLNEIIGHMEDKATGRSLRPNLLTYFAYDSNVVGVLQELKVMDFKWPLTGSNATFELWRKGEECVVKITYSYSKETFFTPVVISLPGGKADCTLENFREVLKENSISKEDMWNLRNKI